MGGDTHGRGLSVVPDAKAEGFGDMDMYWLILMDSMRGYGCAGIVVLSVGVCCGFALKGI